MCVCVCVCVCGWKGLSPSVKKILDNQNSPPGPSQGKEGDASVTKTGTAVTAEWALMYCVSENRVWEFAVLSVISLWLKLLKLF